MPPKEDGTEAPPADAAPAAPPAAAAAAETPPAAAPEKKPESPPAGGEGKTPKKWEDAPEWFRRRLNAASRNGADREARKAGYRNWQEMLSAVQNGGKGGKGKPAERKSDADRSAGGDRDPAAQGGSEVTRLRQRNQQLEQRLANLETERQQERGLNVIQTEALLAGIKGDVARRTAVVLFSDHMERNAERFRGITPEKLGEEAKTFFDSIRQAHPALFESLNNAGATTGPPGGTSPPPAPSAQAAKSDMELSKKDFDAKFRQLTATPT